MKTYTDGLPAYRLAWIKRLEKYPAKFLAVYIARLSQFTPDFHYLDSIQALEWLDEIERIRKQIRSFTPGENRRIDLVSSGQRCTKIDEAVALRFLRLVHRLEALESKSDKYMAKIFAHESSLVQDESKQTESGE